MKLAFWKKTVGLALGGGAALGGAHIGVLKAIEEKNIKIDFIAGTSIGALVGALFAAGKNSEEIKAVAKKLDWSDISKIVFSKFGLLSNKKIGDLVIRELGDINIEDLKIPFAVVSADIGTGEEVILTSGNLANAVMASSAIPGVFAPVTIDGRMLVDGGIVENVPVNPLYKLEAGKIIAVDLRGNLKMRNPENLIEVMANSFDITVFKSKKPLYTNVDVLIQPDLTEFSLFRINDLDKIINNGYEEAMRMLKNF